MSEAQNKTLTGSTPEIPHLKYWCDVVPSEIGKRVAILLSDWAGGSHHLQTNEMRKVDWKNPIYILVKTDVSITGGELSTFDFDGMTRLVFLAHDHCIRINVSPVNKQYMEIMFHLRDGRDGAMSRRHPTIEQALATWRLSHPLESIWTPKAGAL